jgi:hypothetical protein
VRIGRVKFLFGNFCASRIRVLRSPAMRHHVLEAVGDGIESEGPAWEPEPFELPLVEPPPRAPRRDEAPDEDPNVRVVIIDLA